MYSSVLEAHIEVLQGLQKVSAYTEEQFYPEEIDLQLNRQQDRIIEQVINKKFEDTQTGLDYIRPLMVKNKHLQVLVPQTSDLIYEPNMVYGILPANYYHLINDRSNVITSTAPDLCKDLSAYRAANQQVYTEYTATLLMPDTTVTEPPQYYDTRITVVQGGTPNYVIIPAALNNLKSTESWFTVVNYFLDNFKFQGLEIYWENYRDIYAPRSFIFVTTDPSITSVTIDWRVSGSNPSFGGQGTAVFTPVVYNAPNYSSLTLTGYTANIVANLLLETDEFYEQDLNVFYRSTKNNPKSQIANGLLMAYERQSFLISDLYVDYIRKPRHVSLALNQNLEVGGDAPRIIVDRTIEYLKLAIENPAYKEVVTDNQLRNQI